MENKDIVKIFLDTQEWQTFECKRAAIRPADLLETVVGFTNADGGFIVVGLEDPAKAQGDKRLLGISENADNVSDFIKLIDKEIEPPLILWGKFELDITNTQGQPDKLLVLNIKKSNDVHSLKRGDTFVRKGKQNVKIGRPFTIEGSLMKQIEQAIEYFRGIVKSSPPKLIGASFNPTFLIPEWAFQEAITNAVIHRNYFVQDDIQVRFFDDRVEVESPGTYPGHITVENIRAERFARNPLILRTLNRFQTAPNLDIGEGVDRMFKVMKEQNLYEPLFFPPTSRPNTVLLILLNLQKIEFWDTVSKYLDENYRITNKEARDITGEGDTIKMSRLLKLWAAKDLLEKIDSKFKGGVFYKKAGVNVSKKLNKAFARGVDNGKSDELFPA